jgi:hypothetical protein
MSDVPVTAAEKRSTLPGVSEALGGSMETVMVASAPTATAAEAVLEGSACAAATTW